MKLYRLYLSINLFLTTLDSIFTSSIHIRSSCYTTTCLFPCHALSESESPESQPLTSSTALPHSPYSHTFIQFLTRYPFFLFFFKPLLNKLVLLLSLIHTLSAMSLPSTLSIRIHLLPFTTPSHTHIQQHSSLWLLHHTITIFIHIQHALIPFSANVHQHPRLLHSTSLHSHHHPFTSTMIHSTLD